MLPQGAANIFWVPLANTFGRRPVILAGLLILTLSSMWYVSRPTLRLADNPLTTYRAGLATSFASLMAARFFMGCGGASADTVAPDVVGEIFFVHQRGRALAVYTLFLVVGSLLGGLCSGYIIAAGGLPWMHWTNVIMAAVTLVLVFCFQSETLYSRRYAQPQLDNLRAAGELPDATAKNKFVHTEEVDDAGVGSSSSQHEELETHSYPPYTVARSLKVGTYRSGFWHQLIAPLFTLRLPGVWLVSLWYSGLLGGIVTISTVGPTILASPPYLFGDNVVSGPLLRCPVYARLTIFCRVS